MRAADNKRRPAGVWGTRGGPPVLQLSREWG